MADTNYQPNVIPEAPLPISMLPRADQLTLQDLLLLTQPNNPQGQRTKALTLQLLAQFLGNMNFDSITLSGPNSQSLVLTGEGITYSKPHTTQVDQRDYSITENSEGITLQVTGPNGTQKVVLGYRNLEVSSTVSGLTQKINLSPTGIVVSHQERVNNEIVTSTSEMSYNLFKTKTLELLGTSEGDFNWDVSVDINPNSSTYGGLIVGNLGSSVAVHVPQLHVWKQATFEKDVSVKADMIIEKTLTVALGSTFNGSVNLNGQFTKIKELTLTKSTSAASIHSTNLWRCSDLGNDPTLPSLSSTLYDGLIVWVYNDTNSPQSVSWRSGLSVQLGSGYAVGFININGEGWYRIQG